MSNKLSDEQWLNRLPIAWSKLPIRLQKHPRIEKIKSPKSRGFLASLKNSIPEKPVIQYHTERPKISYYSTDLKLNEFGITEDQIVNAFKLPTCFKNELSISTYKGDGDKNRIEVVASGKDCYLIRVFFRDEDKRLIVNHDNFKLPASLQGGGIGRSYYRNMIDNYKKMGVKYVTLFANINIGSYAWARFGFDFYGDGQYKENSFKRRIQHINSLNPNLKIDESKMLPILMKMSMREISEIRTPVIGQIRGDNYHDIKKETMPFGKAFLLYNAWDGILKLDDKKMMRTFYEYTSQNG